jgi:arylsulfatase A-like enzyme
VAACSGVIVAGILEGASSELGETIATVGFFAVLALPVLFVGALITRGLLTAWRPRAVIDQLSEEGGAAPRLVGWLALFVISCAILAVAIYRGTWMLAEGEELQPLTVSFAEPVIAVITAAVLVVISRPLVAAVAHLARGFDRKFRGNRPTLLAPRTIALAAAGSSLVIATVAWFGFIKPRLGPFDTSIVYAPLLGLVVTVLGHRVYAKLNRRLLVGAIAGGLALSTIGFAVVMRLSRPSLAIEIWGDRPLAGAAVELLYDIDDIRADISLAEFRPVDRPGAAHPDIVLVTIDSLRATQTPPYGGNATMPVFGALANRGVVFEWAFAPSNVTRRSIPSMVIGYAPNRIRGRVVGWALRVDPRFVLLPERLAAGGYETAGFMCCAGFWGPEARTGLARGLAHVEVEHDGKQLGELARGWLEARERTNPKQPLFLWVHVLEPHNWSVNGNPPNNRESRLALYNKSLAQADSILASVMHAFSARTPDRAPVVIVTADHGEALGDHGQPFHSTDLYNSQLRVPFVVAGPGIQPARLAETVSLTDLTPTIVDLAGFQPPANLDGRSIADLITGKRSPTETGTAFAAMIKDRSNPGGLAAFVRGRWKLIQSEAGATELYDVIADPDEKSNLASQQPELVRELTALLEAKLAAAKQSPFE